MRFGIWAAGAIIVLSALAALADEPTFQGKGRFEKIVAQAKAEHWTKLPIGELMGNIAQQLIGTPYKGGTLEISPSNEVCSVNLEALDCVTFFETTLDLARMLKKGETKPEDLLKEITYTRYRNGKIADYASRLHYTSDWLANNQKKGVVRLLSDLPGGSTFTPHVDYLSTHASEIPQLKNNQRLVDEIRNDERAVDQLKLPYVPLASLPGAESALKTGDIVGLVTDKPGLDISHTGLVFREKNGIAHFMDASSRAGIMKVVVEPDRLSATLKRDKHTIGAVFARPLEP